MFPTIRSPKQNVKLCHRNPVAVCLLAMITSIAMLNAGPAGRSQPCEPAPADSAVKVIASHQGGATQF